MALVVHAVPYRLSNVSFLSGGPHLNDLISKDVVVVDGWDCEPISEVTD